MRLVITSDENEESGVGEVVDEISGPTRKHFMEEDYGRGLRDIGIVLMCRDPELNFKRRLRFSKKDQCLYMDIMLDLDQMTPLPHEARKRLILGRLADEIPAVLRKYDFKDFAEERFVKDLKNWLAKLRDGVPPKP